MTPSGISLRHDTRDLDALRALLVSLLRDGHRDEAVDLIIKLLADMRDHSDALQVRLHTALRQLYGRRSEKTSPEQLALFEKILGESVTAAPEEATKPEEQSAAKDDKDPKKTPSDKPRGAAHGRSEKPASLPVDTEEVLLPEAQTICSGCSTVMTLLPAREVWWIEYVPSLLRVKSVLCEQRNCKRCNLIVTAPTPGKIIPGGQPGPGLLAKVLVDKAEDHLPLERQQRRLAREGFTTPITTLAGWWTTAADLLKSLHEVVLKEAIGAFLPQIDATGLEVLDTKHAKGIRQGHLWTVAGGRAVAFVYTPVKSNGLEKLLEMRPFVEGSTTCRQPVQCDGENLFNTVQTRKGAVVPLVHDWMHARRYFERAVKGGDVRAAVAMKLIGDLFGVERTANLAGDSNAARGDRRREHAWPILERLRDWIGEIRGGVNPSSPLGKAIGYVERRWISLIVYVGDGRIAIDTGWVERSIRRVAIGRNNWNFSGSDDAAVRLATVATLCATCRLLGIDPWRYLRAVFQAIADGVASSVLTEVFTPWAWAENEAKKANAEKVAAVG
ncbi:MAG: IS66 family transposase [Polyangiales bacterium]